jgi:competence protein ComEA
MVKQNTAAKYSIWKGTFIVGIGIVFASSVAFGSTAFQQGTQTTSASSQTKADSQYSHLPEGQGKATLIRVCGKCHTPNIVIANGQSREGWEDTITKMAGLGATAPDEDFTDILEYLVKNFPPAGKVNVNKATTSELQSQLGFTEKQADNIVAYRQKNGDFKSLDDLKKVPEMDARDIDTRRSRVIFQ